MQEPIITFSKERIDKGDEGLHCCLCRYGKKAGVILWRVEFRGEMLGFHWLLCNRCRFLMFQAMGGKRIDTLAHEDAPTWANELVKKPKQKVSDKGKVRSSYYYSCSWDRRAIMDAGYSAKEYQSNPDAFKFVDGVPHRKKKK